MSTLHDLSEKKPPNFHPQERTLIQMTSSAATSSSRVPRSSSDLFPESLGLSPKQRKVLDALHEFPQGAKISEIAEMLDSHVNTVRFIGEETSKFSPSRKDADSDDQQCCDFFLARPPLQL